MMEMPNQTYSEAFAQFLTTVDFKDVSSSGFQRIGDCIIDQIGCQLVGATLPWTQPIYDYACEIARPGVSTIVGTGIRLTAPDAALVNATFGHGCELDDYGHAGVAVIPPALAIAEQVNASGREFLLAIAVGYEVFFRIQAAVSPQILDRGFHQQVVIGVFAAAATAGRLLQLTEAQMAHAFGIAGSHASGTAEYDQSGGEVKRMHAGLGARGGIQAAMLAKRGLTGPLTILEGKRGIFRTFVDFARDEGLTAGLGREFIFPERIAFKLYPTCAQFHTSIQALEMLIAQHHLRPDQIKTIRVGVAEFILMHGGSIVAPTDVLSAQFSLAFSLGLTLVMGRNDLDLYMDKRVWRDETVLTVARKVTVYADPSAAGDRISGSLVTVETADGRTLKQYVQYRRGSRENPVSPQELARKFESLACSIVDRTRMGEIVEAVNTLENSPSVHEFAALLRADESSLSTRPIATAM